MVSLELQKYEIEEKEYELTNYHNDTSAFFYTFRHDFISYEIKQNKIWEKHLHDIFQKYINKDSVVLEAGCHIGTHSVKLSMLSHKLYCFEPLKESNELLKRNLLINGCTNAIISDNALSDVNDVTTFAWMPFYNLGASGLDNNPMGIPEGNILTNEKEKYIIKTTTIDSLKLDKLDFIKLDVEGYEPKVIYGGLETIMKYKPVITLECWANHFGQTDINHTKLTFKSLLNLNYSIEQIGISDWLFLPL